MQSQYNYSDKFINTLRECIISYVAIVSFMTFPIGKTHRSKYFHTIAKRCSSSSRDNFITLTCRITMVDSSKKRNDAIIQVRFIPQILISAGHCCLQCNEHSITFSDKALQITQLLRKISAHGKS